MIDESHTGPPKAARRTLSVSPFSAIAAGLVILLLGVGVGLYLTRSFSAETSAKLEQGTADLAATQRAHERLLERNWLLFSQVETLEEQLEALRSGESTGTTTDDEPSNGSYTDGTYRVGEDIAAGTYRGTVTGESGYWARLKSTTGTFSGIVTNDVPRGDFILTVYPSDTAVELRGVVLTGPE